MNKTFEYTVKATGEVKTATMVREELPFLEQVAMTNTVANYVCPRGMGRYYPYYRDLILEQCKAQAFTDVKISDLLEWIKFQEETDFVQQLDKALNDNVQVRRALLDVRDWIEEIVYFNRDYHVSDEFFRGLNDAFDENTRNAIKKVVALVSAGMDGQKLQTQGEVSVAQHEQEDTEESTQDSTQVESEEPEEEAKE